MPQPSVLVLYNKPLLPKDHPAAESEHSVVDVADEIARILTSARFRVTQYALGTDPATLWAALKKRRPDVVVNLFEGNHHDPESESHVAGLLEWSGIPFTGSPAATLSLARSKPAVKLLFKGAGLPTADFVTVADLPLTTCALRFPVIVKPAAQDGSVGVHQSSVCVNPAKVRQCVRHVLDTYGPPVLVEEYIPGRELNVALVELPELRALPPTEIALPKRRPGTWPILTYDGKWQPGSPMYEALLPHYPADLATAMTRTLQDLAMHAFRLVGCRDYARVDFRLNEQGQPFILEVNPNPEIRESAGFACGLDSAELAHEQFVIDLVRQAMQRKSPSKPDA